MLKGKKILITGASSGIGRALAKKLYHQGAKLILLSRREEPLRNLQKDLGPEVMILPCDVGNLELLEASFLKISKELEDIDILVNNAGITLGGGSIEDRNVRDFIKMADTNIKGVVHCTQLILPYMTNNNKGHIVNIGSTAGTYPRPGNPMYCASKAFAKQYALALRADLKGKNIRMSSIEPGTVKGTELALGRLNGDRDKLNDMFKDFDYLTPEDIADSIIWTISLPAHVNINSIELMATCQTFSHLTNSKM